MMKVLKFPQEPIAENKRPLNRMAKRALKKVGQSPDPYYLYCLQLGLWALDEGKFLPNSQQLELTLESMLREDPKVVMRVFEESPNGEEEDLVGINEKPSPEKLAGLLLNQLESRLVLRAGYPPLPKL